MEKITFRRQKNVYKPFWWLFLAVCLVCVTPVYAQVWDEKAIYDEIDDSSIDYTLWDNLTTGTYKNFTITENADYLQVWGLVSADALYRGSGATYLNTTNLPDLTGTENITIKVSLKAQVNAGAVSVTYAHSIFNVFGNEIKRVNRSDTSTGTTSNLTTWIIIKNNTGANLFDIYSDGNYDSTITASDNNINTITRYQDSSTGLIEAITRIYYVYLTYNNKTMNITLNSPSDNAQRINPVNFNISLSTTINQFSNTTLYINGVLNQTNSVTGTDNETIFIIDTFVVGNYNWTVFCCDNESNCKWADENRTFDIASVGVNAETYNNETTEGNIETFIINITTPFSGQRLSYGNLIYNNTAYLGSITSLGGDNYSLTRNLEIPMLGSDTNMTFYWNIILEDGSEYNHTSHNQTVKNINIDDCSSYGILFLNLTHRDEELQTLISQNNTVEVDIDIYSVGGATPIVEYYHKYQNDSNPQVCFEIDLSDSTYELYAQILYEGTGYSSEYYHIQNYTLNNDSLPQNINLYDLLSSDAQKFLITFKDRDFLPTEDALITIQRKYVSEGIFKTVEIPKTDEYGQAVGYFDLSGVIYTIIISKYGEVLATFDNIAVVCQDAVIEDCRINLNALNSGVGFEDWDTIGNITRAWNFDESSRTITLIFTTTDGSAKTILLNTTKYDRFGNQTVCSDTLTSSSGTLSCSIPASFGNLTMISQLYSNGDLIDTKIYSISEDPLDYFGTDGYVLVLILMLTLPLMFITNRIGIVIGGILGLIMAVLLGLLKGTHWLGTSSIIIWACIGGGIIIYKITRLER